MKKYFHFKLAFWIADIFGTHIRQVRTIKATNQQEAMKFVLKQHPTAIFETSHVGYELRQKATQRLVNWLAERRREEANERI